LNVFELPVSRTRQSIQIMINQGDESVGDASLFAAGPQE
jgi:hypothetical protein